MKSIPLKKTYLLKSTAVLTVSFAFLMVLASYARIHLFFTPVPVTLQTFVLFLSLILLKGKSYIPQVLYLVMGASGFAVFGNGGSGILYMSGPTGGYLMGFLAAAFIAGSIAQKAYTVINGRLSGYIALFSFANIVIYIFGISWLVGAYGVSFRYAFTVGILPFVAPDIIKIVIAAFVSHKLTRL